MDSDDDTFDNVDSGNVSSGDDDFPMEVDMNCAKERQSEPEDYPYEVLTTEEIVQHMVDCIKEVNTVVEVSWWRHREKKKKILTKHVVRPNRFILIPSARYAPKPIAIDNILNNHLLGRCIAIFHNIRKQQSPNWVSRRCLFVFDSLENKHK